MVVTSRKPNRALRSHCFTKMTLIWLIFTLVILVAFGTTRLLVSDKYRAISKTKTIAGDNLEPTPWHIFPTKTFSSSAYVRASKILQCSSYFTCTSPLGLIHSYMGDNIMLQNASHSCPAFFQWIYEDLAPWSTTGVTEDTIKAAKDFAAFRVVIVGGRLYVDLYYACVQSRMMFTIWGLLQLLERYPGLVPDVDLMFDCMDRPKIERSKYRKSRSPPPPLFRYCSNTDHFDIPFPDWSFWGWPEVNLAPWEEEFSRIKLGSKSVKWMERKPTAYWKGNPDVISPIRAELMKCNSSTIWGAEILRQNWIEEANAGYGQSKLSNQCRNRYKIYTEGFAWSVSFKYILSCDSPVLVSTPEYYDFFTRGLMPRENYWPLRHTTLCPSIKFAVDWGNNHLAEAEAIGKGGRKFMEDLSMDNVYDYMFHLVSEYSKLQKFRPQVPATAQEVCQKSILCLAEPTEKLVLENSIRKTTGRPHHCSLDPPNQPLIKWWMEKKTKVVNDIEKMEDMSQTEKIETNPSRAISEIKTIAGDNLEPTPWHPFPTKAFSSSAYVRASQIFQCSSYLTCTSAPRLIRPYVGNNMLQNTSHSCPAFFQWIYEDLAPWSTAGITQDTIKDAQDFAAFRVVIVGGQLYVDLYYACVQSRMMFTIWGLLQLLERYPGLVPDVDLMFDCMDKPKIERSKYQRSTSPPPPLFRYCSNTGHFDIPFPDWSFWGWPEVNLAPWEEEFSSIKLGSKSVKWAERKPTAYWKGNPDVGSPIRAKLLECNSSRTWGAEILRQNWIEEANAGYEQSKLSNQCRNRYKIYTEGHAWSVSFKYILSCDSPVLVATPEYYDFFTRGLMPRENYWPVRHTKLCPSIKFAVDWGNNHPAEGEAIGKGGQKFMEDLNMDNVYDYMFHLLSEYSKLQKFRPQIPVTAQEVCQQSILCLAEPLERLFLERSIPKTTRHPQPCSLDPPNQRLIKRWKAKKTKVINDIEKMEDMSETKKMEVNPEGKKIEANAEGKKIEANAEVKKMENMSQMKNMPQGEQVADRNQKNKNETVSRRKKKKSISRSKKTQDVTQGKVEDKPHGKRMMGKQDTNQQKF